MGSLIRIFIALALLAIAVVIPYSVSIGRPVLAATNKVTFATLQHPGIELLGYSSDFVDSREIDFCFRISFKSRPSGPVFWLTTSDDTSDGLSIASDKYGNTFLQVSTRRAGTHSNLVLKVSDPPPLNSTQSLCVSVTDGKKMLVKWNGVAIPLVDVHSGAPVALHELAIRVSNLTLGSSEPNSLEASGVFWLRAFGQQNSIQLYGVKLLFIALAVITLLSSPYFRTTHQNRKDDEREAREGEID